MRDFAISVNSVDYINALIIGATRSVHNTVWFRDQDFAADSTLATATLQGFEHCNVPITIHVHVNGNIAVTLGDSHLKTKI